MGDNQAPPAWLRGGCLVHWKRSESDRNTTEMDLEKQGDHVWVHLGLQCRCWEPYCPSCPPLLHSDKITPKIPPPKQFLDVKLLGNILFWIFNCIYSANDAENYKEEAFRYSLYIT